jgi:hypothetical protein
VRRAHAAMEAAVGRGVEAADAGGVPALADVGRMRSWGEAEAQERAEELGARVERELEAL